MNETDFDLTMKLLLGISLGAVLGSFITMLAYRLPRGLSIVAPSSFCPSCKMPLKPHDLVPLLSYLFFKGSCRQCGAPIGLRYFVIEIISTVGIAAIVFFSGLQWITALYVLVFIAAFSALLVRLET